MIDNTELYNSSESFLSVYPDYDLSGLPSWIRNDIENARVYGNSKKCVIMPDGQKFHLDNHLNDMNGKEWTFFINSVFSTRYPTNGKESYAHNIRKIHPTPKPPQLMRDIIRFFSKENELIFDSFMGVGGSLLGAARKNLKEMFPDGYIVLPSSIHEVIVIPKDIEEKDVLIEMVRNINATQVEPQDRLADNVYEF